MAQIIHNTSMPDDGLGDELRTAFNNQNSMNTELYTTKVDKVTGKELSSNDYTDAEVVKLAGIESGAEVNVQPDWNQADNTQDDFIQNKPTLLSQFTNDTEFITIADALPIREVKLIEASEPYTIVQEDTKKFVVLTQDFDVVLPLGLDDNSEFYIKNISSSTREITFDVSIEFLGSPMIPVNGLCILKKVLVDGGAEKWSVNFISEGDFVLKSGDTMSGDLRMPFDSGYGLVYEDADKRIGFVIGDQAKMINYDLNTSNSTELIVTESNITVNGTLPTFKGLEGQNDYTDNLTDLCYPQKIYVDTKIAKDNGTTYDTNFIKTVTQAEYDAITTPDATTLYFIV